MIHSAVSAARFSSSRHQNRWQRHACLLAGVFALAACWQQRAADVPISDLHNNPDLQRRIVTELSAEGGDESDKQLFRLWAMQEFHKVAFIEENKRLGQDLTPAGWPQTVGEAIAQSRESLRLTKIREGRQAAIEARKQALERAETAARVDKIGRVLAARQQCSQAFDAISQAFGRQEIDQDAYVQGTNELSDCLGRADATP